LSALNYFHPSINSSNELVHARKVCQETDIDLIEIDLSRSFPFDPSLKKITFCPNKPYVGLISLKWLQDILHCIPKDESSTFISGHGSDHIFMRPPPISSLSDYILEKGIKGFKEKLIDITHFYRSSCLPILRKNIVSLGMYYLSQRSKKRRSKFSYEEPPDWIKQELCQKISDDFMHPIYEFLPLKVLPGKYAQIDTLYEGLASIHMEIDPTNPTYYPFLYKPVVDFALSIPTYDLFNKGYDRYPLRKAIGDYFRTETVRRKDKSQTTGLFQF
jgi:asparagine synthase (glutamine-hydrolysing)